MQWDEAQRLIGVADDGIPGPITMRALAKALKNPLQRRRLLALRITKHFTLFEMTYSDTAIRKRLHNMPSAMRLSALLYLCETILEPVREKFGPTRITSGYRSFSRGSQHGRAEAGDFEVPGVSNKIVAQWIVDNLPFDQIILEAWNSSHPNSGWIHCSATRRQQRGSILHTPTGRAPYYAGLG